MDSSESSRGELNEDEAWCSEEEIGVTEDAGGFSGNRLGGSHGLPRKLLMVMRQVGR